MRLALLALLALSSSACRSGLPKLPSTVPAAPGDAEDSLLICTAQITPEIRQMLPRVCILQSATSPEPPSRS